MGNGRRAQRKQLQSSWLMVPSTHPLNREEMAKAFHLARHDGITSETMGGATAVTSQVLADRMQQYQDEANRELQKQNRAAFPESKGEDSGG